VLHEGCREAAYADHAPGFITNLIAADRARLTASGAAAKSTCETVQCLLDKLHQANKTCIQSSYRAQLELKQSMDSIREAVARTEEKLLTEINRTQQVLS